MTDRTPRAWRDNSAAVISVRHRAHQYNHGTEDNDRLYADCADRPLEYCDVRLGQIGLGGKHSQVAAEKMDVRT